MSKLKNEKIEILNIKEMNDKDILNDIIESEKVLSKYYNLFMSECSNKTLFTKIIDVFKEVKLFEREAVDILFSNGWIIFKIENEDEIKKLYNKALEELNKL